MGVVYAGLDPRLGRRVAIKVVSERLSQNLEWNARFTREARILASLNHPNIATIHSLERDGEVEFLTMELIQGRGLGELIVSGSLSLADALAIGRQIARGLEAAHQAGVIHRDLKPQNVMVTSELHVKMLDFGLATSAAETRAMGEPAGVVHDEISHGLDETIEDGDATISLGALFASRPSSKSSSMSTGAGTPGYMSPEQIRGEELDPRSDVWAFGCILFELLTGTRAFEGATPIERIQSSLQAGPRLETLPARTPELVRTLVSSCLQRDPEARPENVRVAREVLEVALAQRAWESPAIDTSPVSSTQGSGHPHNLPTALTPFIGRTREVGQLRALLRESRLLTVTGVGGGGKTRVAIRVGAESLQDFPDGVWLVELAPVGQPAHVAAAVARTLGLSDTPGRSPAESIVEHLSTRGLLLILDNCEHVIEPVASLVQAISAGRSEAKILLTSRETLGLSWETVFQLPPLEVSKASGAPAEQLLDSEAVQLFAQRAAQAQPTFQVTATNVREVAEICHRLDGIPLAIELAAARVRVLSLSEISRRLDDRFRLLRGGSRAALPHHQTLEALIDWSHAHLTPNEQRLFRRLSIFRGGWTLEAAESVCSDEALAMWEVLDLLSRLIDKSLVVFGATRYTMLETVREFAWSRCVHAGELSAVAARLRLYFTALAEKAAQNLIGAGQAESLARVDADIDNLRAVFARALEERDAGAAIRLGQFMVRYWQIRGRFREGKQTLEGVLALPGADTPNPARGMVQSGLGSCLQFLGELDAAEEQYRASIDTLRLAGVPRSTAVPLVNLGGLYRIRGNLAAAARSLAEGLENIDESDRWMTAVAETNLGGVYLMQERYGEATASYAVAARMQRQLGDRVQEALALMNMATIAQLTGRFDDSRGLYEQCLALFEQVGERNFAAMGYANFGFSLLALGDITGAREAFARGIRSAEEIGNREVVAAALEGFSQLAQQAEDQPRSIRLLGAADALRHSNGTPRLPVDQPDWDAYLARMVEGLGSEMVTALYDEGAALGPAGAVGYALGE